MNFALAMELTKVTEAAALAVHQWVGRGSKGGHATNRNLTD